MANKTEGAANEYRGNKTEFTKAPNKDVVKPKVTKTEGKDLRSK